MQWKQPAWFYPGVSQTASTQSSSSPGVLGDRGIGVVEVAQSAMEAASMVLSSSQSKQ